MHSRLTVLSVAFSVATALCACNRTPEEPSPSTTAGLTQPAPPAASSGPWGNRCVRPTPKNPPPPVAPGPAPNCPADNEFFGSLPTAHLTFPDANNLALEAELARTDHERERGLMFRQQLAEDHGMLFRMGKRDDHQFWMRNTCMPLDLLFVEDDGLIVGIAENAPTLNDGLQTVGCPSSWVLEVNAGWSRRHGVVAGQHMAIPSEARN